MSQTPRLPVPDLTETCERYLKQVRPLLSNEAFEKTAATTRNFESRKGKELQAAVAAICSRSRNQLVDRRLARKLSARTHSAAFSQQT